eukprot:1631641-Pyramimonas_sp.AAC.1
MNPGAHCTHCATVLLLFTARTSSPSAQLTHSELTTAASPVLDVLDHWTYCGPQSHACGLKPEQPASGSLGFSGCGFR